MPLSVGDKLGHYEVLSLLGQGGMGEVYRARDTTLQRDVALKVLPATFLRDPERMARFQREAQVLASLDHPNIGHIHGIVDSEDSRGLVLALIEGPTLADRIQAGPIPLDEAIAIAKQIIEALEYAHERGVIHRDLKPANVKITPEGVVKVLDFGLAKVLEDEPPASSLTNSPTLTVGHTRAGVILGTAAYMSPEQAVGRPVDRRSDIFSFGALLYEMLTGKRAFAGATTPDVLEAVVKNDPDWAALPGATPGTIAGLLQRCLTKDRKQRLQAIGEARIVLEKPGGAESPAQAGSLPTRNSRWWLWAGLGVATLAAATLGFFAYRHFTEETRVLRLFVPPPEQGSYDTGNSTSIPAVSPDGRRIVFVANVGGKNALWVRDLDSLVPRLLAGTDDPRHPFWSPDSRAIGFFSGGKLKRIDVAGGPAQTLADAASGRGGAWNRDDVIVFAPGNSTALFRVPAAGGTATPVTELDKSRTETTHRYPWFLPDGRHFLFSTRATDVEKAGVFVGDLSDPKARSSVVVAAATNAVYVPPGYLLFMREGTLMAQPFDAAKAKTTGDVVPIAENVDYGNFNFSGHFSASSNGVLAYTSGGTGGSMQLTRFDRTGAPQGTLGKPGYFQWPAISPDGKTVAVDRGTEQQAVGWTSGSTTWRVAALIRASPLAL